MFLRYLFLCLFVVSWLSPCFAPPKIDDDGSDSEEYCLAPHPSVTPNSDEESDSEDYITPPPPLFYEEEPCEAKIALPLTLVQASRVSNINIAGEGVFQPYLLNEDGTPKLWRRIELPTTNRTKPPIFVISEMDEQGHFYWEKREVFEKEERFLAIDQGIIARGYPPIYNDKNEIVFNAFGEPLKGYKTLTARLQCKNEARELNVEIKDKHGRSFSRTNPHPDYLGKLKWAEEIATEELDDAGKPTGWILTYPVKPVKEKEFTPLRPLVSHNPPVKAILNKSERTLSVPDRDESFEQHNRVLKRLLGNNNDLVKDVQNSCPHCVDTATFQNFPPEIQNATNQYNCWTVASFLTLLKEVERSETVIHVLRTLNPYGDEEQFYFRELIGLHPAMRLAAFDLDPSKEHLACPAGIDLEQFQRLGRIRNFFNQAVDKCLQIWDNYRASTMFTNS